MNYQKTNISENAQIPSLTREVITDVYAKEAAQAYQKEPSPLQQACWCKDCAHAETSEDEGKPYCICNNNKSNNWQELMDIYSSCKHCEPKER